MFNRGGGPQGGFFDNFFGGPGGGGHNPNARFEMLYKCYPVAFLGRDDMEKGNKIILPPSALEHLARLNISYPMMFELSHAGARTHCGVLEFIAEEGNVYLPHWMMSNLLISEGGFLKIMNTSLPRGTFVKLRPATQDWLNIHNPRAVLENNLRHFATLTVGDCVQINYNNKIYEIEVIECKPANAISIIEADVNVDFAPPKNYVEPQYQPPASSSVSSDFLKPSSNAGENQKDMDLESLHSTKSGKVFSGGGNRLDGKAIKVSNVPTPKDSDEESDDEPWSRRIPGGVRRTPPYGFNTGNMSGKSAYKPPQAGHKKPKLENKTVIFGGSGATLE